MGTRKDAWGFAETDGRYAARLPPVEWDVRQEFAMARTLMGCGSFNAYVETCWWFLRIFQHPLAWAEGVPVGRASDVAEAPGIVEARTVTRHLSNTVPVAFVNLLGLFGDERYGTPLTYAERAKFLQKHRRKFAYRDGRPSPRGTVSPEFLQLYLGRRKPAACRADEDAARLKAYLDDLPHPMPRADVPTAATGERPPLTDELREAVYAFCGAPLDRPDALREAWRGVRELLDFHNPPILRPGAAGV